MAEKSFSPLVRYGVAAVLAGRLLVGCKDAPEELTAPRVTNPPATFPSHNPSVRPDLTEIIRVGEVLSAVPVLHLVQGQEQQVSLQALPDVESQDLGVIYSTELSTYVMGRLRPQNLQLAYGLLVSWGKGKICVSNIFFDGSSQQVFQ